MFTHAIFQTALAALKWQNPCVNLLWYVNVVRVLVIQTINSAGNVNLVAREKSSFIHLFRKTVFNARHFARICRSSWLANDSGFLF